MLLNFEQLYEKYNMNVTGVIHIGGHFGQELSIYNKYPSIKNVVVFEPDPQTFKILQENAKNFNNVLCINKGLGPFKCKMDFYKETANNGQSNSVLQPALHLQQYPNIIFDQKSEIQIYPLDDFEPQPSLNLINIDVQGFELEVFRGAKKTLKNIKYIITEVNRAEVYKNCCQIEELDEFLGKYEFKRMETNWAGNIWGDSLYCT
jgi:FkbM family methyltransferase